MRYSLFRLRAELKELQTMKNDAIIARDAAKAELEKQEKEVYTERRKREIELQKVRKEAEEKKIQQESFQRRLVSGCLQLVLEKQVVESSVHSTLTLNSC